MQGEWLDLFWQSFVVNMVIFVIYPFIPSCEGPPKSIGSCQVGKYNLVEGLCPWPTTVALAGDGNGFGPNRGFVAARVWAPDYLRQTKSQFGGGVRWPVDPSAPHTPTS